MTLTLKVEVLSAKARVKLSVLRGSVSQNFSGQTPSPSSPWWWLLLVRVLGDLRSLSQDWWGSPGKALHLHNWHLNVRGCWQAWLHKALGFIIPAPRPCVIFWILKDSQSAKSWELILADNGSSVKSQGSRLKQYERKRTCLGSCILQTLVPWTRRPERTSQVPGKTLRR